AEAAEPLRRLLVAGRAPLEAWSGAKTETPGAASTPVSGAVKAAAAPLAPTPNPAATPPQGAAAPALAEPQPAAALRQPLPVTNAAPHAAGDHKPDPVIERAQETARLEFARAMERPASPAAASGARLPQGAPAALAAQIASRFHAGARNFEIRLDPPQLGRVDVRMKLGADNRVQAIMTVERADALGELQRAARELERDLADAGLHLEAGGLTFQLSDQGENPDRDGGDEGAGDFTALAADADAGTDAGPQPRAYGFMLSGAGGVDMRV
ncbi:MAG: flagellar hook-length control protein FliK, partial [Maricaulaceae bacterium]|nr:flagellar hook-length control protein FliK [Maricaulaceae bacterium]